MSRTRSLLLKHVWWIGSALVLIPLVLSATPTDHHLLPVASYFGTSTIWTVIERALKSL